MSKSYDLLIKPRESSVVLYKAEIDDKQFQEIKRILNLIPNLREGQYGT